MRSGDDESTGDIGTRRPRAGVVWVEGGEEPRPVFDTGVFVVLEDEEEAGLPEPMDIPDGTEDKLEDSDGGFGTGGVLGCDIAA